MWGFLRENLQCFTTLSVCNVKIEMFVVHCETHDQFNRKNPRGYFMGFSEVETILKWQGFFFRFYNLAGTPTTRFSP